MWEQSNPLYDDGVRPKGRPVVNYLFIAVCAAVFIYTVTMGAVDRDIFFFKFGVIPSELMKGRDYLFLPTTSGIYDIESPISNWLTLFTTMFIHADILHFAGNMLFLWFFGNYVEVRFGHIKYLILFLASGVAGSWLQMATNSDSQTPIIGASGAIAGILGIYLFMLPKRALGSAIIFIGFWFFIQFAGAVGSLSDKGLGTAYWAHVGGFILGLIVGFFYKNLINRKPGSSQADTVQFWRGRRL